MTLGMVYWILMLLWLVGGVGYAFQTPPEPAGRWGWGLNILLFLLFLCLGIRVFGFILR